MKKVYSFFFSVLIYYNISAQEFTWAMGLGGADSDFVSGMAIDAAGDVYVCGGFWSTTMDADPGAGNFTLSNSGVMDHFVAKYAPDGSFVWAFKIGGTGWDGYADIALDEEGNVLVTGGFRLTVDFDPGPSNFDIMSAGDLDLFVAKYSPDGNFIWAKNIGSTGEDYPDGFTTDTNNNAVVSGVFTGTVDFDPGFATENLIPTGSQDNFILKLNPDGIYLWAKKFGSASGETCYDVETDDAGNIYACGHFWGNTDFDPNGTSFMMNAGTFNSQAYALKWDSNGVFIWAGMFGGSGSDVAYDMALDDSGNMLITGHFSGTGDFNPGVGVFDLVGESTIFYGDIFVLKLDAAAVFIWAKAIGPAGTLQSAYAITCGIDDAVYVSGLFDGTVDFDPGGGTSTIASNGVGDCFFVQLDNTGNFLWASSLGSTNSDYGNVLRYRNGNLHAGGLFSGTNVDLDPTSGTFALSSTAFSSDAFVIKLGFDDVGCDFSVTVTTTSFECGLVDGTATAVVTASGTYTYEWDDGQLQTTPTATALSDGIYSVTVSDGACSVVASGIVENDISCPADMNNDNIVNVTDLLIFMANFGSFTCLGDLDYNGVVNVADMLVFMGEFGSSCQ
ncbi:MAG: hypothetical protein SH856_05155 [Flavobacteriales bacterium]|nr:hypothetical protein [Flavobacteriales bacterium]